MIPILVALTTFGAANGSVYLSSRLIFGAARDCFLPDFLSGLHNKYRTPVPALIMLVGRNQECIRVRRKPYLTDKLNLSKVLHHVVVETSGSFSMYLHDGIIKVMSKQSWNVQFTMHWLVLFTYICTM